MSCGVSVLVAGPSRHVAEELGAVLANERSAFSVSTVWEHGDGLDEFTAARPDCVLATEEVGSGDGLDFLESVRDHDADVVLGLLVEEGGENVASRAVALDVDVYLPWDREGDVSELADRIEAELTERTGTPLSGVGYRTLFEEMNEGIAVHELVTDDDGAPTDYRILDVNSRYEEILDRDRAAVVGELASAVYDTEGAPFLEEYAEVVRTGESTEFEIEYSPLEKHLHISAFSPDPDHFVTVFSDVTARTEARERLERQTAELEEAVQERKRAEERYRSLFENNPIVIWEEDYSAAKPRVDEIAREHGDVAAYLEDHPEEIDALFDRVEIRDVNRAALEYYEADSKDELLGNLDALMTPESRAANRDMWQAVANGDRNFRAETVSKTLTGRRRNEIFEYHVPEAAAEDFSQVYVTSIDITKRKARERQLEQLTERYELAVEGANLGVWDWDMRTDAVYRDERWARMLGEEPDAIDTKLEEFFRRLHPDDARRHERALRAHVEGDAEFYECQYRLRTASGSYKWIQNVGKVLEWEDGDPARAVGIHRDVDEYRRVRERLAENNELLQAVDRVLRHNLNNDMNVIQGYAETIEAEASGRIRDHAERILETGRDLLATVRKERAVVDTLTGSETGSRRDLVTLTEQVCREIEGEYPEAEIRCSSGAGVTVLAVPAIERAIRELLENAIKHGDDDSVVQIDVGGDSSRGWLRVADRGPTIPEMERAILADRKEITPLYHGSGFGLWLVSQAVRRSGGTIEYEKRVPRGNVVTIELPGAGAENGKE
jgi:PAS domain S-box-containing protein